MMEWAKESLEKVDASRPARIAQPAPQPDESEADSILRQYHPDYLGYERKVEVGPNAGEQKFPLELAQLLEGDSPLEPDYAPHPEIETDVLIIGGGGAGAAAALTLEGSGLSVHLATKLRLGDSKPREGRYTRIPIAIGVYAVYYNLLGVSRTWVEH